MQSTQKMTNLLSEKKEIPVFYEGIRLDNIDGLRIPKKKFTKYNTDDITRFKFSKEGLAELKKLYHELAINDLVMDLYNFNPDSIDINIHKKFKELIHWDKDKQFFIQPTPVYGDIEALSSTKRATLKATENGIHLELWVIDSRLFKNSYLEHYWFDADYPQKKSSTTYHAIEDSKEACLISLLDIETKHLPLLKAMKEATFKNLKLYDVDKTDEVRLFFHFPYAPKTAGLHLHIRVNQTLHPVEFAKSISLDQVILGLEKGKSITDLILEHQALYKGYIYSDPATEDLPKKTKDTVIETVQNPFRLKK